MLTQEPQLAAEFIKSGGIVAFPTETVYGLGADVYDIRAIAKIFEAKQRPSDNPLIAHVSSIDQINELAAEVTKTAEKFIHAFFPGPLTLVLPKSERVPFIATAGLDTIGVRMPRFELAHEFLSACRVPVVAPSANLSGKPSPTTWQAVVEDLDGRIDCILKGDATEIGLESTVVDCTGDVPLLLRKGAISLAQLKDVVPETVEHVPNGDDSPRSPGLKHKHYSPRAKVEIVGLREAELLQPSSVIPAAYIGLSQPARRFRREKICRSVDDYAQSLFEFFRDCDRHGIQTIYCEAVPTSGIGAAVMDRLRRAVSG